MPASAAAAGCQTSPDAASELEQLLQQLGVSSTPASQPDSAPAGEAAAAPGGAAAGLAGAEITAAGGAAAGLAGAEPAMVPAATARAAGSAAGAAAAPPGLDPELAEELLCCITHEPMDDPVVAADSYTYERSAITGVGGGR